MYFENFHTPLRVRITQIPLLVTCSHRIPSDFTIHLRAQLIDISLFQSQRNKIFFECWEQGRRENSEAPGAKERDPVPWKRSEEKIFRV